MTRLTGAEDRSATAKGRAWWEWVLMVWGAVTALGMIAALLLDLPDLWQKWKERWPAKVELALYDYDNSGRLKLIDTNQISLPVGIEEVRRQALPIPIRLAVRNREKSPLEVVRVELKYDGNFTVQSNAAKRIPGYGNTLIYEHHIGTLENVEDYTILEQVDVLVVPYSFKVDETVAISKVGIPVYWIYMVGFDYEGMVKSRAVAFDFTVYTKNREPRRGHVSFKLPVAFDFIWPPKGTDWKVENALDSDRILLERLTREGFKRLDSWKGPESKTGIMIEYQKLREPEGTAIYQLILANDKFRRLTVDMDGDGFIDYELLNADEDDIPDKRLNYTTKCPIVDWQKRL
jgi:hypothetical protein